MNSTQVTRLGLANTYLVEEEDGLTLIDTAITGSAGAILAAAEKLGKPIKRLVLTHAHSDHVGSADKIVAATGAELIASAREARLLAGNKEPVEGEPAGKLKPGVIVGVKSKVATQVEQGSRIGSLEVHLAPGHTPGQIALLDTRDGTLFCADAFHTLAGVTSTHRATFPFPFPSIVSWNKDESLKTSRRLTELDPQRLAPGHGKIVDAPVEAMRKAIG